MNTYVAGSIAGLTATLPMTVSMEAMHRRLPIDEQYPLPPREITEKVSSEVGIQDGKTLDVMTYVNHFGYGTACGAVYGALETRLPGLPIVKGMTFGTMVWTASYLGWLPVLGILKPATQHPVRRSLLMIAAHLVFGAAVGITHDRLSKRPQR